MYITENEMLNTILKANAPMSTAEIVAEEIKEWTASTKYREIATSQRYYNNKNDILNKKRLAIGRHGDLEEVDNLSNEKIPHNFFMEFVDQKIEYLMAKPWSIYGETEAYTAKINEILNDKFRRLFDEIVTDAVMANIGWLFVGLQNNQLKFSKLNPLQVIPFYSDDQEEEVDSFIYYYTKTIYEGKEKQLKTFAEFWTKSGVEYFEINNMGGAVKLGEQQAMLIVTDFEGNEVGYNWEKMPLIPVKRNARHIGLLHNIKSIIDAYDRIVSNSGDKLNDEGNKIWVMENANATPLGEFRHNVATYRAIKVQEGAKVSTIDDTADISNADTYIERLKKDMYSLARAVDITADIGANASAEARQYLYANLDMDCNKLEKYCKIAIQQVVWFINQQYNLPDEKINIVFNRDVINNEGMAIDLCLKAQQITGVSNETILANMPWVKNPAEELKKYKAEMNEKINSNIFDNEEE